MSTYLSRLNPAERRFVIVVGLVFFLVINIFWIWPHFDDWGQMRRRLNKARTNFAQRQTLIQQEPRLRKEIESLASEGGYVPPEDQAIQFLRTIQVQAAQSGVGFQGSQRTATSTNQFFMEQLQTVTIVSGENQLVDFLYNLGSGNSMIRVREFAVRPDQNRQQLNANITLVASYQKTTRPAATPARPGVTTARPASPAGGPAPKPAPSVPKPTAPPAPTKK
jgi:type II secretory pathway component PulM